MGLLQQVMSEVHRRLGGGMAGFGAGRSQWIESLEGRTLFSGGYELPAQNTLPIATPTVELSPADASLTPTITRLNAPASAVAQTTVHISATLSIANSGSTAESGSTLVTTFISTSTSIDDSAIQVGKPTTRRLNLAAGRAIPVTVSITSLPQVPAAGNYYLIFQVTDPSGQNTTVASSSTIAVSPAFLSFVPTLVSLNLPSAVVSGASTPAVAKIQIENDGNITSKGAITISLSASPEVDVAGTSIRTVTTSPLIPAGKSKTVSVALERIPDLPTGGYFFVADVTDPDGATTMISTGFPKTIAAPFVNLSASFAEIPVPAATNGETVLLTDNGNIPDNTALIASVSLSNDDAGEDLIASAAGSLTPVRLRLAPGKTVKLHLTGWKSLIAALPAQTPYYLTFTITDSAGNSASGVSQPFST